MTLIHERTDILNTCLHFVEIYVRIKNNVAVFIFLHLFLSYGLAYPLFKQDAAAYFTGGAFYGIWKNYGKTNGNFRIHQI